MNRETKFPVGSGLLQDDLFRFITRPEGRDFQRGSPAMVTPSGTKFEIVAGKEQSDIASIPTCLSLYTMYPSVDKRPSGK
jgi:hypothetical protein